MQLDFLSLFQSSNQQSSLKGLQIRRSLSFIYRSCLTIDLEYAQFHQAYFVSNNAGFDYNSVDQRASGKR